MKKVDFLISTMLFMLLMLVSCDKLVIPNEDVFGSEGAGKVTICTRSVTGDIQYPVCIYAFDEKGKCAASQVLASADESLSLSLSKGTYQIVTLSNTEGYVLPSSPNVESLIEFASDDNCAFNPLQVGQANITVGELAQNVNVVLSYKVAPITFTLENVPEDVTSISVAIHQQYSTLNMKGEYASGKTSTMNLEKSSATTWTANCYVFPGSSTQTVFSISLTDEEGTSTYGYTYNSALLAATPYHLKGNYASDMINLSGSFSVQGWSSPINLDFSFGPNGGNGNVDVDNPSIQVSKFPVAGSVWENHIVAYAYNDAGDILDAAEMESLSSVNLLLLSLDEWTNIKSAYNTTNPEHAMEIAESYKEGELSGWTIPTEEEVMRFTSIHNVTFEETLEALNKTITSAGGLPVVALTKEGSNVRYLCEGGLKTYVWRRAYNMINAGASTKYSLRLVNRVKVSK